MPRNYLLWFTLAFVLLMLTACLSLFAGQSLGSDTPLEGTGTLTCSTECMDRGQCGTAADESLYVLGALDAPTVANHNRVFADNTPVQIINSQVQNVQNNSDGQRFSLTFYQVTTEDLTKAGWVAGWCIASR
ncbi:MAG: hypothetical protein KDE56_08580 [Anaerolineales bacterium]|nr:hypothetical protein [Anaerolineales bacterium]